MARNPGTRLGRPPKNELPAPIRLSSGERQGRAPTDGLDMAFPAKAFPRNGAMPRHHDDPSFIRGNLPKRR